MRNKSNYALRAYTVLMMLFISEFFISGFAQTLPYTIDNNSRYADDEIYIGLVGNFAEQSVWMDMTTSEIKVQTVADNTLPGPAWSISPGGSNMYANMFYKLSDIPNNTIQIPLGLSGCRIFIGFKSPMYLYFFGDGGGYAGANLQNPNDPNDGIRWELVELTWGDAGLWTNTSRVDAYQYPMGLEVNGYNGAVSGTTYTERYYNITSSGNPPNFYKKIGEILPHQTILDLWNSSNVGPEFQYCKIVKTHSMDGEPIIEQPSKIPEFKPGALHGDYFDPYIDDIWETYRNKDLLIQIGDRGIWTGRVSGNRFDFTSPDGTRVATIYDIPTTIDAIEGAGQLASTPEPAGTFKHSDDLMIQAQICAAINRHAIYTNTPEGVVQYNHDASRFFQIPDYNDYVAFFHDETISFESQTYAFCYDDVGDHSSTIQCTYPTNVKVTIGGFANQESQTITSVVLTPASANLTIGESQQFTATAYDASGNVVPTTFTWSANAPGGMFSASTEGTYVVSASADDISGTATVNVSSVINNPPDADAGFDQSITLPTSSVVLDGTGSSDPDSDVISYSWIQINGPNTATISGASTATPTASGLIEGVYGFELTVFDGEFFGTDQVTVTVNPDPGTGDNCSVTETEFSFNISSESSNPTLTFTPGVAVGSYVLLFYKVDNNTGTFPGYGMTAQGDGTFTQTINAGEGSVIYFYFVYSYATGGQSPATETYNFTVGTNCGSPVNEPPVIIPPQPIEITLPINSYTFDASSTYDPNGDVLTYAWSQVSGPSVATLSGFTSAILTASDLIAGEYTFELLVSDGEFSDSELYTVNVLPVPNDPPVAVAGPDQTLELPVSSVSLDGNGSYDPNGDAITYAWSQVSGPSVAVISGAASATATANGLIEGVYEFSLSVSDAEFTVSDIVKITVEQPNRIPVIPDFSTITDEDQNCVTIELFQVIDPDNDDLSFQIVKVSGPNGATIEITTENGNPVAYICNLIEGAYAFEIIVNDGNVSVTGQFTLTVLPVNHAPVAIAGGDQTIQLPTSTVILDGTGSYDPDGDALTYEWSTGSTNPIETVDLSIPGVYVFTLTVSDGEFTVADQITVTVVQEPTGCIVSAANGDFSVEITNDGNNPSLTFIPGFAGVGDNIVILYYKVGGVGTFPGYIVQPNVPYQINANAGDHVYLYYTYSLPTGGERNSAANKNDFIVGQCSSTLKEGEAISLVRTEIDVNIYPNPAKEELFIDLNGNSYSELTIFNLTGMKVLNQMVTEQETVPVSLNGLESGTYFIKLDGASGSNTELFIIE